MLLSTRRLQQESEITVYSTAVTIYTTSFKIRQILHFAHTIICVFRMHLSIVITLNIIERLMYIIEMQCVYCEL
jgi:hypothetical protein